MSSRSNCIFEIHHLWRSGFSSVYSNCFCSCSFESEIIKIGHSSYKMYSNNIVNFQESTTILNACTKKVWKLIEATTYLLSESVSSSQHKIEIERKKLVPAREKEIVYRRETEEIRQTTRYFSAHRQFCACRIFQCDHPLHLRVSLMSPSSFKIRPYI